MKIFFCLGILMLVLLPSCKPFSGESQADKRLAALEHSVAAIRQEQIKTRRAVRVLAIRQDLLKKGIRRAESRVKNDRVLINRIGGYTDEDAAKIEDLETAVNKMIDPIQKLRGEFLEWKAKFQRFYQEQEKMGQLAPDRTAKEKEQALKFQAPAGPPVDKKKRKKVLESVA